jgi:hypothetical protein
MRMRLLYREPGRGEPRLALPNETNQVKCDLNNAFTLLATRSATLIPEKPQQLGDPLLMPANESLHLLKGDGAIVVGIHGLEDALVSRLKLLQ